MKTGKAYKLFDVINSNFIRDSDNVIAAGLDKTNTSMGEHNSSKFRILENDPSCFIAGCNCHLADIAATKGSDCYSNITGFDIEDHQVNQYCYFKNSTKRKGIRTEFLEREELIRYVSTRCCLLKVAVTKN